MQPPGGRIGERLILKGSFGRIPQRVHRVLVIDDDLEQLHSFAVLLKEMGHAVDYAINGRIALDVARRFKPDCVICDLGMPGLTGFEVAARLRTDPELEDLKVIALTGYPQLMDRARAAVEFDAVHAKPLDPKVLYDMFGDTNAHIR